MDDLASARWARGLFRARWFAAAAVLAVSAAAGWQARGLRTDPSNTRFFLQDARELAEYEDLRRTFGSDETIWIGAVFERGLRAEDAAWLQSLADRLADLDDVESVRSLADAHFLSRRLAEVRESAVLTGLPAEEDARADYYRRIRESLPDGRFLISPDGRLTTLLLFVDENPDLDFRRRLIENTRAALERQRRADVTFYMAGTAVEQDTFLQRIGAERERFIPLTVCAMVVMLLLLVDPKRMTYALAVMGCAVVAGQGALALGGEAVTALTGLLAPIVMIVAVSAAIHLSLGLSAADRSFGPARLERLARGLALPSLLAALTTVVGFLSLLLSSVPAVRAFGMYGAAGSLAAWIIALALAPLFLADPPRARRSARWFARLGVRWAGAVARRARGVLAVFAILLAGLLAGLPRIQATTDLAGLLRPEDPFRVSLQALQSGLDAGIYGIDIVLRPPGADLEDPAVWAALDRGVSRIESLPGVTHSLSPGSLVGGVRRELDLPLSRPVLRRILNRMRGDRRVEGRWISGGAMRLIVYMRSAATAGVMDTAARISRVVEESLPGWGAVLTGQTLRLARMSQRLVRDQTISVVFAVAVILVCALAALRSFTFALIALLPNLFPLAALFGIIGYGDIALSSTLVTIATVAMGLIFDNTIHLLFRYRRAVSRGTGACRAVLRSFRDGFRPAVTSSAVLAAGFAVPLAGRLRPTLQFGGLTCAVIVVGLLADLLLLPALLLALKPGAGAKLKAV